VTSPKTQRDVDQRMPGRVRAGAQVRPHMQGIASELTGIYKAWSFGVPFAWMGFVVFIAVASDETGAWAYVSLVMMTLIGALMGINACWMSRLADDVRDAGEFLVFEKGGVEARIGLGDIESVRYKIVRPHWVVLRLREKSRLGNVVRFLPTSFFTMPPPVVDELHVRIAQATGVAR
jgi:hypothetical protein